ncbi:MAG: cyclic nucleotide-binding domain-containing protein, partial [Acidobacteria bacterium]|nr:cyclic nucleotide-binding domain-containing protein [Acidobacteriota bacterium]
MLSQKSEILAQTSLFAGLARPEIEALAQRAVEKRYVPGEFLFHEGEECAGLFVLGQGSVKIFKTSASGREVMLAVESAPSSVAEVPLFDGGPYPASVRAIDDVVAYLIGKKDFQQVCRQHPEIPLKVLAVTGRRLRHLVGIVESVTFG